MDWNGWHSIAQARGDGLRSELIEGLERAAWRAATVIELDVYRRETSAFGLSEPDSAVQCTVIPFPVHNKSRNVVETKAKGEGLKPRLGRAKNLSRTGRARATQQPE